MQKVPDVNPSNQGEQMDKRLKVAWVVLMAAALAVGYYFTFFGFHWA